MAAKAASVLSRRIMRVVMWAAITTALLALTPHLYAESLLDKAIDAPSSPAGGNSEVTNSPAPQTPPLAPIVYKPRAPSNGSAPYLAPAPTGGSSVVTGSPAPQTPPIAPIVYKPFAPSNGSAPYVAPAPAAAPAQKNPASAPVTGKLKGEVTAVIHKFDPLRVFHEHRYQIAAAEFPAFCHDWELKLQERTQWGISQIQWHLERGLESGTYTGYSPINSCTTKMSEGGVAIGKLSYEEHVYSLSGKTIDEAKHAPPKQVSTVRTLEIFRYDHNKWFE